MNISFSNDTFCDLLNQLTAAMLLVEEVSSEEHPNIEHQKFLFDLQKALFSMKEILVDRQSYADSCASSPTSS